ncbi:putative ubiquinone biosynthesis protein [Wickerhamomyces ciferrii]|uniref:Ubiquinone biosynthesis protein n=1 Tax=Wickerhamomyces ciferrii (strain ATCC 14091 / BCRC 22168 / CBS 111 / JCM 3599 / NBRC 0793 / NRRL Y-1031 F-60-10) TaxID=1206466 RepID=K0KV13_WICCF|nr:putative ubiquinone biosynthesis protein [Wickerhamomyces ciferrii]CCH45003.1 putative ubiquinone biosynthesis protein [Wickerhamomyces ciferrii]
MFRSLVQRRFASSATSAAVKRAGVSGSNGSSGGSRFLKFTVYGTGFLGAGFLIDKYYFDSAWSRTAKSFYVLARIGYDYKFKFNEQHDIAALHEENADRFFNLLNENKGLYIKLGQNIANQASILPPAFQKKFAKLYDSAAEDPWEKVDMILQQELGTNYNDYFNYIEKKPIASASIAQVHKAELKTGEQVALKVQHYYIAKQIDADLMTYRVFTKIYEYFFEIPVSFTSQYICDHLKEEVDFRIELQNGEKVRKFIADDGYLHNKVHVPINYQDLSTKRILASEWCDGLPLTDYQELKTQYNTKKIMKYYLELFSKMIFQWGFVHSDPHPGNLLVRYNKNTKIQEIVLLDHGLYVEFPESLRYEYCALWKSLFELNDKELKKIAIKWGIGSEQSDMFASFSLLKPYHKSGENLAKLSNFERQEYMKENFKKFFQETEKFPLELIFLGRSMRMIQLLNQKYRAPVNRINLFTREAVKGYYLNEPDVKHPGFWYRFERSIRYSIFVVILTISDITFYTSKFSQYLFNTKNVEDLLQDQMLKQMKEFGIENPQDIDIFSG